MDSRAHSAAFKPPVSVSSAMKSVWCMVHGGEALGGLDAFGPMSGPKCAAVWVVIPGLPPCDSGGPPLFFREPFRHPAGTVGGWHNDFAFAENFPALNVSWGAGTATA